MKKILMGPSIVHLNYEEWQTQSSSTTATASLLTNADDRTNEIYHGWGSHASRYKKRCKLREFEPAVHLEPLETY